MQAIDNIFTIYEPDVIAVHTTCLSETIGDDIPQIARKAEADGKIPEGKYVIHANTPSYVGSHVTGFANMTKAMVDYFAAVQRANDRSDQHHTRICRAFGHGGDQKDSAEMGVRAIVMFPDTSNVLNRPQTGKFEMYPKGGVTVGALESTGDSKATIALGADRLHGRQPARSIPNAMFTANCSIFPIGLKATDAFVDTLRKIGGSKRARISINWNGDSFWISLPTCTSTFTKKVGLAGDPDQLISLTEFLVSIDMWPIHIVTGTRGRNSNPIFVKLPKTYLTINVTGPEVTCSCSTSGSKTNR